MAVTKSSKAGTKKSASKKAARSKSAKTKNGNKSASNGSEKMNRGNSPIEKFFTDMLKDMYYTEEKLIEALGKMESAATTEELKEAFNDHAHQSKKHQRRLEKVFELIGKKAEAKKCDAIEGIISEAEKIIEETPEGSMTRDAALIIAAQKAEHYEIASYGSLVQLAITMGLNNVADLLDDILTEEERTDQLLTDIAETSINMQAENEEAAYSWMD